MAKIREYTNTQTIDPQPLAQAAYRVERTGMIEGAAMRDLGNMGAHVINRFEDSIAQNETSDVAKQISAADLDATAAYEQEKQTGDMSDPEFAQKFVDKHLQPSLDKIGDNLLTPEAQKMFQQAQLKLTSEYTKRAVADQATFAGQKAVDDFTGQVKTYSNLSTNDPTTTEHNAEMMQMLAPSLPNEHRAKLISAGLASVYESGAKGYLLAAVKNPNATTDTLDLAWQHVSDPKNGFVDHVDPSSYDALKKEYETARESLIAGKSAQADLNWDDLTGRIRGNGGLDTNKEAQSLIDSYQGRNAEATQLWKAAHQKNLDEAVSYGKATVSVPTMAEPDIIDKIGATQAQIDKAAPGDIGKLTQSRDAMISALKQRDREFQADSAAYVLQNSSVVASRYQDYQKQPTAATFDRFAQASIAEQRRLYPDAMPRLVTGDMAQAIGQNMAAVTNTPEGATMAGSMISQYANVTGKYWPQVAQELYADKVFNPNQFVAASMWSKPEAVGLAQDLLRASTMKPDDLSHVSGVTQAKADKAALQALAPLRATMVDAANGGQLMSAYENALSTLVRYKGDTNAAGAIATKMIMGEYQFRGSLRMPNNVDASAVVSGTKAVQADIGNHKLIVPPSFSGAGPHDQRAEYVYTVQSYGHWSTASDGKTALLYDEQGTPVYETVHGHRAQVALDWKTLDKLGTTAGDTRLYEMH